MNGLPAWHPESLGHRRRFLDARARITSAVRDWFAGEGFTEVDTPALQVSPCMEPHLQAFATMLETPEGERVPRYLHTSPEFAMKKLLVGGMERIYQLGHVFRNRERAAAHAPEFTMLEWYRAGAPLAALVDDCAALLWLACTAAGTSTLAFGEHACDPTAPVEILTVAEAFQLHCGIDLLATAPDPAQPDLALLAAAAAPLGIRPHGGDRWEDLFFRLMLERVEPRLGIGRATALCEYPISMAALARPKPEDPRVAERFELYACGVELANGFGELTDAAVQRARFEADMDLRELLYGERYPIDEDFLAALCCGMPDSSGIALGFDRLVMLASGAPDIASVQWLPVA
ncbi:MAG TPA: EF-P lysine aminoacylase EpmA [Stellaceae bacterium]|nr:EF-P lysine aminoacylase EpmA [Stellaceae bacterium]